MTIWLWVGFIGLIVGLLALDLGVLNRKAHAIGVREACGWVAFWVSLALGFNVLIYFLYDNNWFGMGLGVGHESTGWQAATAFLTGYLIEQSLSLDNIFVIALIITYFKVPPIYQHRLLFWGILGALIMRGTMIGAGVALIRRFEWVIYVFGVLLLVTAVKLLVTKTESIDPNRNRLVRLVRRFYPVTPGLEGSKFLTRLDGRRAVTPLFVALLVIETTDLMFAVDSIPAIFAVTRDPFIVFTSNIFAILGLRSLYFALAGIMHSFRYVNVSLVFVLGFVGVKMLLSHHFPIPTGVSLAVIAGLLAGGVVASLVAGGHKPTSPLAPVPEEYQPAVQYLWRQARRVVVVIVGTVVVLIGVALIVLPGPAFVVIPVGIAILATEFVWAQRVLRRLREHGTNFAQAFGWGRTQTETEGSPRSSQVVIPSSDTMERRPVG